ncbi:MAG: hypothetical protein FWF86_00620 [Clostridia bacterium]|nr:hypothetical protein [Clostridia bacterium]
MKSKFSIGVCCVIALALVLFGLIYGTLTGFNDERRQVTALLAVDGGLMEALRFRGADGLNLCMVARRHLAADDPDVRALETAAKNLRDSKDDLSAQKREDDRLTAAAAQVAEKLQGSASFLSSSRDQAYLNMLAADMGYLAESPVIDHYNQTAADFNALLDTRTGGALARLLGVKPCELYR